MLVPLVCFLALSCAKDVPKHFTYNGADFVFYDVSPTSVTVDTVLREVGSGDYRLDELKFENGDVIVDVGANVGVISILLAKMNPGAKIYAFEPVPRTYRTLMKNIAANKVTNITAVNKALTADGRR
jgi:methylase of polypeptide subunit release factors